MDVFKFLGLIELPADLHEPQYRVFTSSLSYLKIFVHNY